ncbi:MAG TPA: enoyl-CoA hydratase-related protein [Dehalococcoidia bacterium]|nr:enoyl-CoA hydratase-related protein [Dehalococcoidia bacterium]
MPVDFERRGQIAVITLNRPEKLNALDTDMMLRLGEIWEEFRDDDGLHVAIVTGAGERAFCSGRDLAAGAPGSPEHYRAAKARGEEVLPPGSEFTPKDIWKPIIAAINGHCLAAGFALALACDIRIAATHATIGTSAAKRGLLAGGGQIQRLARYVPFGRALEMLLVSDAIDAETAYQIGLVNRVVPLPELMPAAIALAERICENAPLAVQATKEVAYRGVFDMQFEEAMKLEAEYYNKMLETEDVLEGARAFQERRKPEFKGR